MGFLRSKAIYCSASDVLRYELLKAFGGVYVDCDLSPPTDDQGFVDLQKIVSFQGLTLMTEHDGRNVGTTAIFVGNSFIIASPEHPVILSLVDQVYKNAIHWQRKKQSLDPMFMTGPFLLNKVINGCFNTVPCKYLHEFHVY